MNRYLDKLILNVTAVFLFGLSFGWSECVTPLLVCAIIGCLQLLIRHDGINTALFLIYCIPCIFFPSWFLFLPVLLFDVKTPQLLLPLIPTALFCARTSAFFQNLLLYMFLCGLGILLNRRSVNISDVYQKFIGLHNESEQSTAALVAQNRELADECEYAAQAAQFAERNRIARDIHDRLGHKLTGCILMTGAMITNIKDRQTADGLQELKTALTQAMEDIRKSVHNLYEPVTDIESEISELAKNFKFCPVELDCRIKSVMRTEPAAAALSVVKEAFSNLIKHSNATRAWITLHEQPGFFKLTIRDNGTIYKSKGEGLGLKGLKERIAKAYGLLTTTFKDGFCIHVTFFKKEQHT